jgi:putative ABC transport system substrate-binding protein
MGFDAGDEPSGLGYDRAAMLSRRRFLEAASASVLTAPLRVQAQQQAGKVYRLGYLSPGSATAVSRFIESFRQRLRELGWVEGQNIAVEYRFAEGQFDRLPDLAAELVRLKADVVVAIPTHAAVAAKNATATIPIVMANVGIRLDSDSSPASGVRAGT